MFDLIKILAAIVAILSIPAAWITHIVWWVSLVMTEQLDTVGEGVLAVLGTLAFPVGVIHGFIIWFTQMEFRKAQRQGFCRGCDDVINRGDTMFYTYSFRNRGQNILFCLPCIKKIIRMFKNPLDNS